MTSSGSGVVVGDYLGSLFRFDTLPLAFLQCTTADADVQTYRLFRGSEEQRERMCVPCV